MRPAGFRILPTTASALAGRGQGLNKVLMAGVAAGALLAANAAYAGNIVLTGHDNDLHEQFGANPGPGGPAGLALAAEIAFVRNGSSLPVLTFDAGTELTGALTDLGIPFTNVNPSAAISPTVFDNALYSAFAVASVDSCGGCDNSSADIANVTAQKSAIDAFFNNGGGILGLAGADDANAYAYVPTAATNPGGSPPSTGYVQTTAGAALGLPATNGNPTHNFFDEPGSGGLSSAYVVTERLFDATTGTPETIAVSSGTTTCIAKGTCSPSAVPEPGSMGLLGFGLIGVGLAAMRQRYKRTA